MVALERVSEIWLVAKMVHDLFEAILVSSGFDNCLPKASAHERLKKLDSSRSRQFAVGKVPDLSVDSSPTSAKESPNKTLTLTPGLIDHLNAALKSATIGSRSESSDNSSRSSSEIFQTSLFPIHNMTSGLYPVAPPTENPNRNEAHSRENDFLDMEDLSWIEPAILRTPAPTGLNTAEW
jgi:hypothetical protein